MLLAALIIGLYALLLTGMYFVVTRPLLKRLEEISRKLERAARPSAIDPASAFRTLDDK